ncbi:MAG: hypothetical protein A2X05_10750 [Bacteroidetes bacterium GWE2_41_25]|nr:MAG: hypothetical protein A2X03_06545 [Bacteroidetes bacterium GWA2_40_15]OFX88325.1 MAG: hypothetical protein A2X06_04850 [Bacteroidetes bacterium GWC2_40_22]OFY02316.1 MAG: hypothetical protein A2X05_10750 [Bacteroidetes bacterium GWE2_41_25]HBH85755.1 hypothetical protein [Bacteroidales bacterium]HBQ84537.1 hypothetical protein [Bacteroidales bacterium]
MHHKVKIIVLATAVMLLWNELAAQYPESISSVDCPREKISALLSQENVFTGEILWFKIYCSSILFPGEELSSLAFIELVSSENTSILRKKILLKHGEGTGEFKIPENLPTGIYYILAYTNWMKNFGEESFFRKEMIIVNPYQPFSNKYDSLSFVEKHDETSVTDINANKLKIIPDKNKYSTREHVTMKIETVSLPGKTITGRLSVSVYRKEPKMIFSAKKSKEKELIKAPENITFMPDYHGILLSGKLTDNSGHATPFAFVTASSPGKGTDIKSHITDRNGNFHFLLEPKEGEKEIVITLPAGDMKISLEESFWNGFRGPPDSLVLILNREAVSFLKEKYACYQLLDRFKKQYFIKNTPVENVPDTNVFYSKPHQLIKLGNYIDLDSLREYFYELVPAVKFAQRNGEIEISVLDPLTMTYVEDKPGIFLDGILYDNFSAIADIPVEEIDRIAVLPTSYYYKDFSFGGIIDIHTKKSDFNSVKPLPNMTRFIYPLSHVAEWRFLSLDYSIADPSDRIPDLRFLLHWEPVVRIEKSGEALIQFYTGDVKGIFVVKVVGLSDDGEILQAESEINVY